ncbi:hypothetical protein EJB05_42113, partial [Eragrostis curvula]
MASRRIAAVVTAAFLVCALLTWTPEAARMGNRGEVAVAGVNANDGGIRGNAQRSEFIGHRPRLASFTRRDDVAPPSVRDGSSKREVPGGPDPIHHPGDGIPPSSSANP